MNLNLDLNPLLLEDYKEAVINELQEQRGDTSRNEDTMNWEQFRHLLTLILRNQSTYFRDVYNNKKHEEMDLQKHLERNEESLKECFKMYDVDDNGSLCFCEFKELLMELNLHRMFARHWDPNGAFDTFCHEQYRRFDLNDDQKISYDEFVNAYNTILDR